LLIDVVAFVVCINFNEIILQNFKDAKAERYREKNVEA
jgi:hypothetical protein